ncbi:MAG: hypothetical protein ACJA2Q_001765 [Pseudohongiellaceae bacterium]|jgi:hypothetical protein
MLNQDRENLTGRQKLIGLLAPMVVAINCIGIVLCITVLYSVGSSINERSGGELLQQIRADYSEFEILDKATRKSMVKVGELEASLDTDFSEKGITDMASTLIITERNAQLFLRLLKVNVYNLAGLIPGTASWYEIYAPVIDAAIERSRLRLSQLLQIRQHYQTTA